MIEIIIGIIGLTIGTLAFIYQFKEYKKKKIPKFKGRIGIDSENGDGGDLFEFVNKNEGKIVFIDIFFDNDEDYKVDENGIFYFSFYFDKKEKFNGGFDFRIEVKDQDDFFYDSRWSSKRLKGNFKILGFSGPQMGWFTTIMKPVNIESVS